MQVMQQHVNLRNLFLLFIFCFLFSPIYFSYFQTVFLYFLKKDWMDAGAATTCQFEKFSLRSCITSIAPPASFFFFFLNMPIWEILLHHLLLLLLCINSIATFLHKRANATKFFSRKFHFYRFFNFIFINFSSARRNVSISFLSLPHLVRAGDDYANAGEKENIFLSETN